jgi:hypothetical protein
VIGLAAEWPFVSQPDYTGPLVKALGGADVSWLAGWFAAAGAYLLLAAFTPVTARRGRQVAETAYGAAALAVPASGGSVSD